MDGETRGVRDGAPGLGPRRSGRRGWWARLDQATRRSLMLCRAVAVLVAVLFWPVEWLVAKGYWEHTGVVLAVAVAWLAAPLGGALLLGWRWTVVYGLFYAGVTDAVAVAEETSRWDAWAKIVVFVVGVAAAGAVLRGALMWLLRAVRWLND